MTMKLRMISMAALASLAACTTTTYRPQKLPVDPLLPSGREQARIHDGLIRADQRFIESLQGRIKALNDKGIPVQDYQLARAQCWLSFGLEEYHENDRTGIIETALGESRRIIESLENGAVPAPTQSPVATAVKLRPDLWAKLDGLRASPYLSCAGEQAGCLEVVLNEAGHDYHETGWRHARAKIAEAERMAAEAQSRISACSLDRDGDDDHDGVPNSIDQCPHTPPNTRVDARGCDIGSVIQLPGVNFANNSATLLPESSAILDEAAATLKRNPDLKIEVQGHTDSRAGAVYNLHLSQHRAQSVLNYLKAHGVTNELSARGYGKTQPIADNGTEEGRLKNRRVVLSIQH